MEHMFKKYFSLALLFSTGLAVADCNTGCNTNSCNTTCNTNSCNNSCDNTCALTTVTNCFLPRSQSRNNALKDAGLDPDHQHLFDMDNLYGTFNIAVEYTQSFRNNRIAECLFGPAVQNIPNSSTNFSNCCPSDCDDGITIRVAGTAAPTSANGTSDLVAQNFFLPSDFSSVITISPSIRNVNVPLQLYLGCDEWCSGFYFRLYGDITNTRWKLEANENVTNAGVNGIAAGFVSPVAIPRSSLFTSFLQYASGGTIPNGPFPGSPAPAVPVINPITVQPLGAQRIINGCEAESKTGFADLRAELGWDFLQDECYHLGVNIQAAAPTGNKCSDSCLLFAPIIGNNQHWELGGGVTGHYTFWRSEDDEQQFDLYVDADVTHMFKRSENRVFDLNNKPLSRYMFAKLTTADPNLRVGSTVPNLQFANVFAPIANISMQNVDVQFAVQGDVVVKFVYTCRGFGWELGYNFWGRSCQQVELNCECSTPFPANTWALADSAQLFGFEGPASSAAGTPHDLPATVSGATVFSTASVGPANIGVDNAMLATYNTGGLGVFNLLNVAPGLGSAQINGSNPAVPLVATDFNLDSGSTRGISHKVFTHFNYTWIDCEDWIPYVGIGASAEFGSVGEGNNNNNVSSTTSCNTTCGTSCNTTCGTSSCNTTCGSDSDCSSCGNCALSQWAVWIKGGVSFN